MKNTLMNKFLICEFSEFFTGLGLKGTDPLFVGLSVVVGFSG